jgi:hypothetical protein
LHSCKTKLTHFPSITCRRNTPPECKLSIPVKHPQTAHFTRFTNQPQNRVQPQYGAWFYPAVDLCPANPVNYSSLAIPACCRGARRSPEGLSVPRCRCFRPSNS